jgi:hypothetical protein
LDEEFGVDVTVTVKFIAGAFDDFKQQIFDQSNGQIEAEMIEENPNSIMPA